MSVPTTPVRQIIRARRVSPPPAPRRNPQLYRHNATYGVDSFEASAWDALVASNPNPLLLTPPHRVSPMGGSPAEIPSIALPVIGLPAPASTPTNQTSMSGLPLAPRRRVRTLSEASASWESDTESEEELLMTPPLVKRFRAD
jgi:hypothetical protein